MGYIAPLFCTAMPVCISPLKHSLHSPASLTHKLLTYVGLYIASALQKSVCAMNEIPAVSPMQYSSILCMCETQLPDCVR